MNIKVEALENNQVKFSFEVDADDVDARIKRTYRQGCQALQLPWLPPWQGSSSRYRQHHGR